MTVRVRYFARLRELLGQEGGPVEVAPGTTVRQLFDALAGPKALPLAASMAFAINMEYAMGDHVLRDGDEVAFLPPVSGG